jgi:hypothetical protein
MVSASKQYRDVIAPRQATIAAAITHLRGMDRADLQDLVARLGFREECVADPVAFIASLKASMYSEATGHRFGAWKAAQQVLQAVGLPFMPDDYKEAT